MDLIVGINSVLLLLTIIFNLGLAIYIFLKDTQSETHSSFSAILVSIAFWAFSFFLFTNVKNLSWVLFLRRLTPCGSAILMSYFLY
ncbi:MAG: hypothetical protein ACPL4K_04175, partial [Candidatus Margulisiibacteriota bacterium]